METTALPRILVVDDEEAILETMTFTFMDTYEVLTSSDAEKALEILDENSPVAVVITDQRMPTMTGVEFLAKVVERHPETSRIMLTGFADMAATVQAINDGQVYAYVNKPWETDQLKQLVTRACEHHNLIVQNQHLLEDLQNSNLFLEAVMDRLDTGAIALDADGIVRAANQPARTFLELTDDPRGRSITEIMSSETLEEVAKVIENLDNDCDGTYEDVEVQFAKAAHRIRMSSQALALQDGQSIGRVILFKEVSHEPLRRRFDEIILDVTSHEGELRPRLERAVEELRSLASEVAATGIASSGMGEMSERASRTETAIANWLDVDDTLAREEFPDAQLLLDRMRVASQRWPRARDLPSRVGELVRQVEAYYESGENTRQRIL